jgi:hypothetical protein
VTCYPEKLNIKLAILISMAAIPAFAQLCVSKRQTIVCAGKGAIDPVWIAL